MPIDPAGSENLSIQAKSAAITGIGAVTNCGVGFSCAWEEQMLGGPSVSNGPMRPLRQLTAQAPSSKELELEFARLEFPRPSRSTMMALLAAREAWNMAAFATAPRADRVGLMISRSFGEYDIQHNYYDTLRQRGPGSVSGLEFVRSLSNTLLGRVAMDLQARGPSLLQFGPPVFCTALDSLRRDEADVIVAGGVDVLSDFVCDILESAGLTLSVRQAANASRSSGDAPGILPAEGAAFIVLEQPRHALARGARPIAYLLGGAITSEQGDRRSPLERTTESISLSIRRAIEDSSASAASVKLVSSASTGLERRDDDKDDVESDAIQQTLSRNRYVFSTKSTHGETWGASGALALASAASAIATGYVPGTSASPPDRLLQLRDTNGGQDCFPLALSLSFDLPGLNSAFVIGPA
jgi:3-oxoacyl-[acyl-carrier-protein] synthase II